jgi:hypothetical protein
MSSPLQLVVSSVLRFVYRLFLSLYFLGVLLLMVDGCSATYVGRGKKHIEELHDVYSLPSIISVIKSRNLE